MNRQYWTAAQIGSSDTFTEHVTCLVDWISPLQFEDSLERYHCVSNVAQRIHSFDKRDVRPGVDWKILQRLGGACGRLPWLPGSRG